MGAAIALGGVQAVTGLIDGLTQISRAKDAARAAREAGERALEAAEANAILLEDIGRRAASDQRKLFLLLGASQRVAFARNGVNVGTGSSLDVALDTAIEGEVSAQRAQFGFESAAYRERVKGLIDNFNAQSQASLIESGGQAAGAQTILGGANAALGTLGNLPKSSAPSSGTTVTVPSGSRSAGVGFTLPLHSTGSART